MAIARKNQIDLSQTPYYHCTSRCVRRAFLCGEDPLTGRTFHHRKQWLAERIALAGSAFAIDVCAYAIMSNHYHLVLRVNIEACSKLSDFDVAQRWLTLYHGHPLVRYWLEHGDSQLTKPERSIVEKHIALYRKQLTDISWFMRFTNEYISRRSNKEDDCKGHFWEARFDSQALLDESALLTCMAYVDLNPIRASLAQTPEASSYTSIQSRLQEFEQQNAHKEQPIRPKLLPFMKEEFHPDKQSKAYIPYLATDYFELVDWTGRSIRADKSGVIPQHIQPILDRINISSHQWIQTISHIEYQFSHAIGLVDKMQLWCESIGLRWCKGISCSRVLFR
ncbi:transposase [Algicola sagamiensis]|uniref:transposase n=1 Tax=Algicola sagamiensis TaxID=163869 RepID=UPI0003815600|nr:transposase [Algicola sagamiensis]